MVDGFFAGQIHLYFFKGIPAPGCFFLFYRILGDFFMQEYV